MTSIIDTIIGLIKIGENNGQIISVKFIDEQIEPVCTNTKLKNNIKKYLSGNAYSLPNKIKLPHY